MGLITPGPVVITATFIGYLVGGVPGALVATGAIFTPIYLGVVVPGPWFVRHRDNPHIRAFVRGATAAASGALAGATVIIAREAVYDAATAAIAAVCAALILRFRAKEPVVVALAAVAGLALY
jgi:chromate transporter